MSETYSFGFPVRVWFGIVKLRKGNGGSGSGWIRVF